MFSGVTGSSEEEEEGEERKKKTLRELAVLLDCKSAAETTNRKWQDEKQVQVCGNNPVGIFTTLFLMDLTEW